MRESQFNFSDEIITHFIVLLLISFQTINYFTSSKKKIVRWNYGENTLYYLKLLVYMDEINPIYGVKLPYVRIGQVPCRLLIIRNAICNYEFPSTARKLHPNEVCFPIIVQDNRSATVHQIPGTSNHFAPSTPVGISGSGAVT